MYFYAYFVEFSAWFIPAPGEFFAGGLPAKSHNSFYLPRFYLVSAMKKGKNKN